MATNKEPALRRKTPLLICSSRTAIPYPCMGSSASVFRMSMSRVPWTSSLDLSAIGTLPPEGQGEAYASPLACQEEEGGRGRRTGGGKFGGPCGSQTEQKQRSSML